MYSGQAPLPASSFPDWSFRVLGMSFSPETRALYVDLASDGVPSFTPALSSDMALFCGSLRALFASDVPLARQVRYVVTTSRVPGIFSMGGDLDYFADCIMDGDREALTAYAHNAVAVFHAFWTGFGLPVVTLAVVDGDALGGGYETALVNNFIVAEEGVRLGLPEVTFNIFPGMGAISFLTRRIGAARAKEVIFHGKQFPVEKIHEWGGVDWVVPAGTGRRWLHERLSSSGLDGYRDLLAARDVRMADFDVSHDEMRDVVDAWVDGAMAVDGAATSRMKRVAAIQRRQMAPAR